MTKGIEKRLTSSIFIKNKMKINGLLFCGGFNLSQQAESRGSQVTRVSV
jgi:hypothetical protein